MVNFRYKAYWWQGIAICLTVDCAIAASIILFATLVRSQIQPDNTLPVNSIVTPNGNSFTIDGGSRAGGNLFHSFQEFSLPTGSEAFFNNAADVQNIITRVTGSKISNIDGLMRANGSANLFLLNPAGIIFGPNASLNIGGSFIGTTANSIKFADGVEFSAVNPTAPPLLSINVPIGLQMGQNPGLITVNNTGHNLTGNISASLSNLSPNPVGLQVASGQTLALVGGDLTLNGGILTAPSGRVELGAIGNQTASTEVGLQSNGGRWQLTYGTVQPTGNLQFLNKALVNASGTGQGAVQIQGGRLTMKDGSIVWLENRGSQAGTTLELNIADEIDLIGAAPNTILASGIYADTRSTGSGSNILVNTGRLTLQEGGNIQARAFATGNAGTVTINASSIDFLDSQYDNITGVIGSRTRADGNGNDVIINTESLRIQGGVISTANRGNGNGGNVLINASKSIELSFLSSRSNDSLISASATSANGNGGNITINTPHLLLNEGGAISSSVYGAGNGGTITVNATESVTLSGQRFNFGTLSVEGSSIRTAGILLADSVRRQFGLPDVVTGTSGNIMINTPKLNVTDGAEIAVRHDSVGAAGELTINTDLVMLDRNGQLSATTVSARGGNINIQANRLLSLRHGSNISATAGGTGDGGNININASILLGLENSDIIANAVRGSGGNINITTQGIFGLQYRSQQTEDSDITASSQFGLSGTVTISNPEVDTRSFLLQLPQNLVDVSQQITSGCEVSRGNTFTVAGRGGLPEDPTSSLLGRAIWWDDRDLSTETQEAEDRRQEEILPASIDASQIANLPQQKLPQTTTTPEIVEATSWKINAQGQVELVADVGSSNTWIAPANCRTLQH